MALNNKDSLIDLIMDADSILNECLPIDEYEPIGEALATAIDTIRNAKPVMRGEWIVDERHSKSKNPYMDDNYYRAIVCSNCGNREASACLSFGFPELKKRNYCPECGADMRGDNNGID